MKKYFDDYRFSEDLDLHWSIRIIRLQTKFAECLQFNYAEYRNTVFKINVIPKHRNDKVVGYETHIRFWGANHKKNHPPPPSNRWLTEIKIEIIFYETVVNKPVIRKIFHNYSDRALIPEVNIPCYSLIEIIAEKFRALLQRSYPAPRDYYDLWFLTKNLDESTGKVIAETFHKKCTFKAIKFNSPDDFMHSELAKVQKAWNNSLSGHLAEYQLPSFEKVVMELKNVCKSIKWK